jgi:hypothetical protein
MRSVIFGSQHQGCQTFPVSRIEIIFLADTHTDCFFNTEDDGGTKKWIDWPVHIADTFMPEPLSSESLITLLPNEVP